MSSRDPLKDEEIRRWAQWVADTILVFGGNASTAYACAGIFAAGLENEPNPLVGGRRRGGVGSPPKPPEQEWPG